MMETTNIYGDNRLAQHSKVRVAARGVILLDGKLLLSYEVNTGQYFLPGGGLEDGETISDCCVRELAEETGFVVAPLYHFATINEHYGQWLFTTHYFTCEIIDQTERHLTPQETVAGLEPRWVPLEEAIRLFSGHQDHADNEMKRGAYFREYQAMLDYRRLT